MTEHTAGTIHERTDKLDFLKMKIFCSLKDTVKRMKRQVTDWDICKSRINKGRVFI